MLNIDKHKRQFFHLTKQKIVSIFSFTLLGIYASNIEAQNTNNLSNGTEIRMESSTTLSNGKYAPLWLSSNRYGLSSVEHNSNYERVGVFRSLQADSVRKWRIGYGMDVAGCIDFTSDYVVQQAYFEVAYQKLLLSIGSKERSCDLKNNELTSGGLSLGINARPIPQVRGEVDYVDVPGMHGWWQLKGRLSYGWFTDGGWQTRYLTDRGTLNMAKHSEHVLYHEKAMYWKFGKEEVFPLTFEIGLQMAAEFGGTLYQNGVKKKPGAGLKDFLTVFIAGGHDSSDGPYPNTEGNQLGSYNMALMYKPGNWLLRAYFERYFEDQSMMAVQYGIYDHLLGLEMELPANKWVRSLVVEHLSTRDQSGAVYHDRTTNIYDKMNGRDDYYNHGNYMGWQHWGMALGNPLITSPIYNTNGDLLFHNNRVQAWHVGISGDPSRELHYRVLLTHTENWGRYVVPFEDVLQQNSFLVEACYKPRWASSFSFTGAWAWDRGKVIGNSHGIQFTIQKYLSLNRK